MSQPFSVAASPVSNGHAQSATPAPYHPALPNFSAFPGLVSFAQSLNSQSPMPLSTPTQQSFFPQLQRPSSSENSDLEKLERLKKEILEGQNPVYKAVPQPNFLESLYLGRSLQAQKSTPAHSDQVSPTSLVSNNPHLSSEERTDNDIKTNDLGRSTPPNHFGESSDHKFVPSVSFQTAQNVNGANASLKSSQTDQRPPNPNDMPVLDTSKSPPSNGNMDSANNGYHVHAVQQAIRPASVNASAQSTSDSSQIPSGALNKHRPPGDPPYDPKESLRQPNEGGLSLDERNRRSVESRDVKSYDPRYGHPIQDSERDRHYNYRFDERRVIPNGDRDSQNSPIPGLDTRDLHLQDLKYHDSRYNQNNRMDRPFKPTDDHVIRGNHSDGSSPLKPVDGVEQARFVPSSAITPPGLSHHQPLHEAERSGAPALGERIGGRAPTALEERIGIRIPLEERVPTPLSDILAQSSALQERIGERVPLEERIGSRPASTDIRAMGDTHSIPTPLTLVRARPGEEKFVSSSPTSTPASARTLQRVEERPIYPSNDTAERPNDRLQSRSSVYGGDSRSSVQGSPTVALNGPRPLSDSESLHREKFREASDPRLIPSAAYRDDRDRRYSDAGRSISAVGHYERPILIERDSATSDDRARPALDTREWHERASYPPKPPISRSEGPSPPHGSDRYTQRVWTSNDRGHPSYDERYVDRRSAVPARTWDRDDVNRTRPPPEVYPPIADERYPPVGYREPSRVHGRSPSPGLLRPAKRVRDDAYYDDRDRRYAEPPPGSGDSYYDSHGPYASRGAHETYSERSRAPEVAYYDRRAADMGPPRSIPFTGRAIYSRPDLDKYSAPPPRTA